MKYNITIDGEIGYWPFLGRVVRDEVISLKGKPINVYVNSRGGSVVDALEMYQAFREHGDVTVHIFGFTASAATLLAMGAKNLEMSQNALMLIHKASLFQDFWGSMNSDQLDEAIKQLEDSKEMLNRVDEIIANIYALRAGGTKENFLAKMKKAEWLKASQVKDLGLIDKIIEETPSANGLTNEIKNEMIEMKLPLPDNDLLQPDKPSFAERVKTVLTSMGFNVKNEKTEVPADGSSSTNELNNEKTMNKDFSFINTALGVEGVTNADGKVSLSLEDLKKINDALKTAQDSATEANKKLTEKDNTISDLQTQIENLKKGDGDSTANNEGEAKDSDDDQSTGAFAEFQKIKDFIY